MNCTARSLVKKNKARKVYQESWSGGSLQDAIEVGGTSLRKCQDKTEGVKERALRLSVEEQVSSVSVLHI